MNKQEKIKLANDLRDRIKKSAVTIFADYKGLSATQADNLRRVLRTHQVEVKVLKNNIARMAVKDGFGSDVKAVFESTVGPTLVALSYGDVVASAKAIFDFAKTNEALKLKDSLFGDKKISAAEVETLAKLPSREVMLAMVAGTMLAPIQALHTVLSAVPRGLVTALAAIEKKKSES